MLNTAIPFAIFQRLRKLFLEKPHSKPTAIFSAKESPFRKMIKLAKPDIHALLTFLALLAFFYFDFLSGTGYIWEDSLYDFYPHQTYFSNSIASGHFPLWMPYVENGVPFFSSPPAAVFYPFTWLLTIFLKDGRIPYLAFQWYIVAHMAFAGICVYFFLKEYKLHPVACLIGAITLCFSATMVMHVIHPPLIRVYAWWPLQFLLVQKITQTRKRKYYFWLTIAILMSLLAGFPATTVYGSYALIAYWIFSALKNNVSTNNPLGWWKIIFREAIQIAATFAAVLLLAACFLIPGYEGLSYAPRFDWNYRDKVDQSLPPYYLSNLLAPNFFGTSTAPEKPTSRAETTFWGEDKTAFYVQLDGGKELWLYWEYAIYAGQIFLIAVAILIFNWKKLSDRKDIAFFLILCVVSLWFVLGKYGGLFKLLYYTLPGISMFREPTRFRCVFNFAAAIVCAFAVDSILRKKTERLKQPYTLLAFLFGLFFAGFLIFGTSLFEELKDAGNFQRALHWSIFSILACSLQAGCVYVLYKSKDRHLQNSTIAMLVIFVFADFYFVHGSYHTGKINPDTYYADQYSLLPRLKKLREEIGPFRVAGFGGAYNTELLFRRNFPFFHPEIETLYGYVMWWNKYTDMFRRIRNIKAQLDIQNVAVLGTVDANVNQIRISRYMDSLPRAKFYNKIRSYESDELLLNAINNGELDYKNELGVTAQDALKYHLSSIKDETNFRDSIRVQSISPEKYLLHYNVPTPGVIFISEAFFPGWEVRDDQGNSLDIIRVFGAFRGIIVPKSGVGTLTVQYRPKSLQAGLLISFLSCLLISAAWFLGPLLAQKAGWPGRYRNTLLQTGAAV